MSDNFQIKDSGKRAMFDSGMVRDTVADKIDYARTADGPMLKRWAEHLTAGAEKYPDVKEGTPNWMLAVSEEERIRFKKSAYRHFMQWYRDERDEDHGAAVMFNINGAEHVLDKRPTKNPPNIATAEVPESEPVEYDAEGRIIPGSFTVKVPVNKERDPDAGYTTKQVEATINEQQEFGPSYPIKATKI